MVKNKVKNIYKKCVSTAVNSCVKFKYNLFYDTNSYKMIKLLDGMFEDSVHTNYLGLSLLQSIILPIRDTGITYYWPHAQI